MTIKLKPEQQHMIDSALRSGVFHDTGEVIDAALAMLAEDIEDGMVAEARDQEPRSGGHCPESGNSRTIRVLPAARSCTGSGTAGVSGSATGALCTVSALRGRVLNICLFI